MREYRSIHNLGDVFIFKDSILVTRKQQFLISSSKKPLVISYKNLTESLGNSIESFFPKKFIYWDKRRMEVQIELGHMTYDHVSATLTLKNLDTKIIGHLKSFEQRIKPIDFRTQSPIMPN